MTYHVLNGLAEFGDGDYRPSTKRPADELIFGRRVTLDYCPERSDDGLGRVWKVVSTWRLGK